MTVLRNATLGSGQEAAMLLQVQLGVATVYIISLRTIVVVQSMEDVSSYVSTVMDDALVNQATQYEVPSNTFENNSYFRLHSLLMFWNRLCMLGCLEMAFCKYLHLTCIYLQVCLATLCNAVSASW